MQNNCWESSIELPKKYKPIDKSTEAILNNKPVCISLNQNGLQWQEENLNQIFYSQIINVRRSKKSSKICINYIYQSSTLLLKLEKLKIKFSSLPESENWSKYINKNIKNFSCNRIKNLFIFVDTNTDRCVMDAKNMFEKKIKHIINDLKISYELKEIQTLEDIDEISGYINSIKIFNGVVIIGGDETASRIISNIINSFQTRSKTIKNVPMPFGIIPIGHHNDISNAIWQSENIENAFLNIILGNSFQADILSISTKESKPKIWGFNFHFGYYNIYEKCRLENQINNVSEKENSVVKKAFKILSDVHCHVKFNLSVSSAGQPIDQSKCSINCSVCNVQKPQITNIPTYNLNSSMNSNPTDELMIELQTATHPSNYKWIIVNSIPCINELTMKGFTPSCHYNDGTADLVLVKCKKKKEFKKFLKLLQHDGTHLSHSHVYSARIESVDIFLNESYTSPNLGKLVTEQDIEDSNEIVIIDEDSSSTSTEEVDQNLNGKSENINNKSKKKKGHKLLKPIVKAYKDITKTTYNNSGNEFYKKPNMLESEKEKEKKEIKKKNKDMKEERNKPIWMLDYNFLSDFNSDINIKVYSGLITFFGRTSTIF